MSDFNHKIAFIIGKSVSTMAGIARDLHTAGMLIVLGHTPSDADAVAQIAAPLDARTVTLSVDHPDALDSEIAAVGQVDMVIIVPGWFKSVAFLDSTSADWDAALHDNFEQSVYAIRAAGKHLQAQGHGSILVLSSVAALTSLADLSVVSTSLAALHVVARLAAVELAPHGVTVNVVTMGWIPDEWTSDYLNAATQPTIEQVIPMQRLGTFADIAGVCRLLASDDARYITGAVLSVDGGYGLMKASTPPPPRKVSL